ncbi:MAG: ribulokinase [Eubacteriales bacterium]|nr:ribulokinase [Eubacteriales bacterium]
MQEDTYTIGLDFGTLSGRGILVRCRDGKIMASAIKKYAHGVMDEFLPDKKTPLPDAWCLEHPQDYLDVLDEVIPTLIKESEVPAENIIGIGIDFTSCTMLPVDKNGVPLCFQEKYASRRNAYVKLWKHHGAQKQADKVNSILDGLGISGLPRFGGKVSPELLIPKIMEILEEDPEIYECADEILEAGDWLSRVLTGSHKRSCSMAGYKAWWSAPEGYVEKDLLEKFDSRLKNLEAKMPGEVCSIGGVVGRLDQACARRFGLKSGIAVAPAVIDSHAGVPGSGITDITQVMMVLGTSSVMVGFSKTPYSGDGICGGVKDAIIPGYYAFESGLASVGDLFGWFTEQFISRQYEQEAEEKSLNLHSLLCLKAKELYPGQSGLLALDWWNGNKTPYVDGNLTGQIMGMTLNTKPEEVYRALIEATAFGTKKIIETYEKEGVHIEEIIASGGISNKNELLMQIYADVLGKNIAVVNDHQTAALGSAIYAALSAGKKAGGFDTYREAVAHMGSQKSKLYKPDQKRIQTYQNLYQLYRRLSKIMGAEYRDLVYDLRKMKREKGYSLE